MDMTYFAKVFAALFAIMNPIASLPLFLALSSQSGVSGQRKIAWTVILGLVVGTTVTALTGTAILAFFGISLEEFRLAGGLLTLLIALNMLHGERPPSHAGSPAERGTYSAQDNPSIYPLTVPLLLGPGAISTLIIFRGQSTTRAMDLAYVLAVVAIVLIQGTSLLAAPLLSRLLGQMAIVVMGRLMGMILAAIAMDMMITSLRGLLPGLAR